MKDLIGKKVRSIYGCCGIVVAIIDPKGSIIVQMDDGRANRCHRNNFNKFYKILDGLLDCEIAEVKE